MPILTSLNLNTFKKNAPSVFAIYSLKRTKQITERIELLKYKYPNRKGQERLNMLNEIEELQRELELFTPEQETQTAMF